GSRRAGAQIMPQAWLWFPDEQSRDAAMATFASLAAAHGYLTERGTNAGKGNVAELVYRIASGEVATVLLSDEERDGAIDALRYLRRLPEDEWPGTWPAREAFSIIAAALEAAREREEAWLDE